MRCFKSKQFIFLYFGNKMTFQTIWNNLIIRCYIFTRWQQSDNTWYYNAVKTKQNKTIDKTKTEKNSIIEFFSEAGKYRSLIGLKRTNYNHNPLFRNGGIFYKLFWTRGKVENYEQNWTTKSYFKGKISQN